MSAAAPASTNACDLAVVWAYRRTGKFAFHVLTGALESAPDLAHVEITFANGVDAVCAAIDEAQVPCVVEPHRVDLTYMTHTIVFRTRWSA